MNLYTWNNEPVTPEKWGKTYDEDGIETGQVLIAPSSEEVIGLVVTQTESKTLADVNRVIGLCKPQKVIDKFIALYLPTLDPSNILEETWYAQHLLVESNDSEEVVIRNYFDENGDAQEEILPNAHQIALLARTKLEVTYPWLTGLRGEIAPTRPAYVVDIQSWKDVNIDYKNERAKDYIKEMSDGNNDFERAVGNCIDVLLKFASVIIPTLTTEQMATDEVTEMVQVLTKIKSVKDKHPKKEKV